MTNPFRAMCAELHTAIQLYTGQNPAAADIPANDLVRRLMDAMAASATALATPLALHPDGTPMVSIGEAVPADQWGRLAADPDHSRTVMGNPTPQSPAAGEVAVNLRMDLSSECLKRLCDGLAAAVKPNGGYRELTTDDDISGEFIGEQQVGVEWWLPEHGCDSLENTLDSIKGRLLAAVRDWLPTAVISTPQPPAAGEVAELVKWLRFEADDADRHDQTYWLDGAQMRRIAELLQRQHPQPVPVSERPWERKGWCDEEGRCWLRRKHEEDGVTWRLMTPASVFDDAMPIYYAEALPANALPTP